MSFVPSSRGAWIKWRNKRSSVRDIVCNFCKKVIGWDRLTCKWEQKNQLGLRMMILCCTSVRYKTGLRKVPSCLLSPRVRRVEDLLCRERQVSVPVLTYLSVRKVNCPPLLLIDSLCCWEIPAIGPWHKVAVLCLNETERVCPKQANMGALRIL